MQHFLWDDYILFIGKTNSYVCNEWFKGIPGVESSPAWFCIYKTINYGDVFFVSMNF